MQSFRHITVAFALALVESARPGIAMAEASASTSHDMGGGLLLSFTQVRDDALVPLRFLGPGVGLSLGYAFEDQDWRFESRLRTTAALLFDRYGTLNAALLPSLDVSTHRQVTTFGERRLSLGAFVSLHEAVFYPVSWDDAHAYWLGVTSIGPSARLTLPAGERHIALEATTPLLALVSRPPRFRLYKVDNLVSAGFWLDRFAIAKKLTSLHQLQALRLRGTYQGRGPGFRIDPWAELEIETFSQPARFIHASFYVGAEARFGL